MININTSMLGLLAPAVMTAMGMTKPTQAELRVYREENLLWQKRLIESGLTQDQQQWNKALDDKHLAKKNKK